MALLLARIARSHARASASNWKLQFTRTGSRKPEPNRGHYVAQLRNSFNIRETTPESRTRVKFCVTVFYKIPVFLRF